MLSQAVAIQAGPKHAAGSASPAPTLGALPTTGSSSQSPGGASPSIPLPTSIHPHLIDVIRYNTGTTSTSPRSLNREWVQLTNAATHSVTITGWTLRSSAGAVFTFPPFVLGPGGTIKIHSGTGTNSSAGLYWGRASYVWSNTKDVATLRNASGVIEDLCRYYDPHVVLASHNC